MKKTKKKTIELVVLIEGGVISVLTPKTRHAKYRVTLHHADERESYDRPFSELFTYMAKPHTRTRVS